MTFHKNIFWLAVVAVILATGLAEKRQAPKVWRDGYSGHGTTHEQMGMPHWNLAEFTLWTSVENYSTPPEVTTGGMGPAYRFGAKFLGGLFTDNPPIPRGYVSKVNGTTFVLGPKVDTNNWYDILRQYFLLILLVFLILLIIVITPFLGVCYCCFCCCLRRKQGCPACQQGRDNRRRLCCGLCLFLLIPLILLGLVIAFISNRTLDKGLAGTKATVRMGSEDTCRYLKDVGSHINHLFVYNYHELDMQMTNHLRNAHQHIFMDLGDTSGANSLTELERILMNMPKALRLMRQVQQQERELRFLTSMLRDSLRGVKIEIMAAMQRCRTRDCQRFVTSNDIMFLDSSECLHLEGLPDSSRYVKAMEEVVAANLLEDVRQALGRMRFLQQKIKVGLDRLTPPVFNDLSVGKAIFERQGRYVNDVINAVISKVHLATLRSTKSFDDVYHRFNDSRAAINTIVCVLIVAILVLLVMALLCGCLGATSKGVGDGCCSKVTGSWLLCVAIVLIFAALSLIFLVALSYFMVGAVIYEGACAPLRDLTKNNIYRLAEPTFDLNKMLPHAEGRILEPLKLESVLDACRGDQAIFNYLKVLGLYDVDDLVRIRVISSDTRNMSVVSTDDVQDVMILDPKELGRMSAMRNGKIKDYHSSLFSMVLCNNYVPIDLLKLARNSKAFADSLPRIEPFVNVSIMLSNQALHLRAYEEKFHVPLQSAFHMLNRLVANIDSLILYENYDFGTSIQILLNAIGHSQNFIRSEGNKFIAVLFKNLTEVVDVQTQEYISYLVAQANREVGHCKPLSYIYDRSLDLVCRRLADPINGYWVGLLLCGFLLIPVLILAHFLMCLYAKIGIIPLVPIVCFNCPICTAATVGGRVTGAGTKIFDLQDKFEADITSVRSSCLAITSVEGLKNKYD